MSEPLPYTGRFAPSPTGPLHFGSLLAAVASYLEARRQNGRWLVRIEDIDPPREEPGAADAIVAALERYGFEWDGSVLFQRNSGEAHRKALDALDERGLLYRCGCSRADLADAPRGALGIIYPGHCRRDGCSAPEFALRVKTTDDRVGFVDRLQGDQFLRLQSESGDFIVWRRDGLVAYQLAVVVDDEIQGVTDVVRGIDLMDSTPRQIWLQQCLGFRTPGYAHIPVAVNADGSKLSKMTGAEALPAGKAVVPTLVSALEALRQKPPAELGRANLDTAWDWALANWQPEHLRMVPDIPSGNGLPGA